MAKKRVTRKQLLKEPDEFITTTGQLITWAKENAKTLGIGASVFFVIIVAVSIYAFVSEKRSNAAHALLGQVVMKYQAEAQTQDGVGALSAVSGDIESLVGAYDGQSAGKIGYLLYGHMGTMAGDYDKAIECYRKALDDYGDDPSLKNIIHNGLGTAYQQKGDYPKAVEHYQKIVDGAGTTLKDAALFNLAKLLGQIGKSEESRLAYQRLKDEFPDSAYAGIAREKK